MIPRRGFLASLCGLIMAPFAPKPPQLFHRDAFAMTMQPLRDPVTGISIRCIDQFTPGLIDVQASAAALAEAIDEKILQDVMQQLGKPTTTLTIAGVWDDAR